MRRGRSESPVSFFSFQDVMMCTIGLTILVTLLLILQIGSEAAASATRSDARSTDVRAARQEQLRRLEELTAALSALQRRRSEDPNASLAQSRAELLDLGTSLDAARSRIEDLEQRLEDVLAEAQLDPRAAIAIDLMRRRDALLEALADTRRRKRITYLIADRGDAAPTVAEVSGARAVISFDADAEAPLALVDSDPAALAELVLQAFRSRPDWESRYLLVVLKPSGIAVWERMLEALRDEPRYEGISTGLDLIPEAQWTTDAFPPPSEPRR